MQPEYVTLTLEGIEAETDASYQLLFSQGDDFHSVEAQKFLLQTVFDSITPDAILENCGSQFTAQIEGNKRARPLYITNKKPLS